MEALRQLFLTLGLDADDAKFNAARKTVDGLEKALELALEAAERLADYLVEAVKGTGEYADKMMDTAEAAGLTTDQLQKFEWAAAHSGIGMQDVAMATERLSRAMYESSKGGEEAQKMFAALGVHVMGANGKLRPTYDVLEDVAESFRKMPPGAERTGKAMEMFGRAGAKMIPLLAEGREGFRKYNEEAEELGVVMSEAALKGAKDFQERLEGMEVILASITHEIGAGLIKALDPLLKRFQEWIRVNRKLISERLEEYVVRPLTAALNLLVQAFDWVVRNSDWLGAALRAVLFALVGLELQALTTAGAMVSSAVSAAAAWLAASWPLVLAGTLLAAAYLLAEDFYTMLKGGDSVIGRLSKQWYEFGDAWMRPAPGDSWLVAQLKFVAFILTHIIPEALTDLAARFFGLQKISEWFGLPQVNAILGSLGKKPPAPGPWAPPAAPEDSWSNWGTLMPHAFSPASTSPGGMAEAQAAASTSQPNVTAPVSFAAGAVVVHAQPGQDVQQVAETVADQIGRMWKNELSAAYPVVR